MRISLCSCFLVSVVAATTAHADTVTDQFTFNLNLRPGYTGPPTLSGSFQATFDPTQTYTDQTSGLTINSFSYMFPGTVVNAFNFYPPTALNPTSEIVIGGLVGGVGVSVDGSNDYFVFIQFDQNNLRITPPEPSLPAVRSSRSTSLERQA